MGITFQMFERSARQATKTGDAPCSRIVLKLERGVYTKKFAILFRGLIVAKRMKLEEKMRYLAAKQHLVLGMT